MIDKLKDFQLLLLGLLIASGMVASTVVVAGNISKDNISVTGSAYEIVKSDSAEWSFEVAVKNADRTAAFKALKDTQPVIKQYLLERGIEDSQINIAPPNSYETHKNLPNGSYSNDVDYYNYTQTYKISSNDVEKIKDLSVSIHDLVEQGITVSGYTPEYQYSKISDLKIKLLGEATKDAKQRADAMLKANNDKVGSIRSVKMGVFQITPPNSNSVTDYGINDSSTIEKKVTAVANVVFAVK